MGASKIGRISTTKELSGKKVGVQTVGAAFTAHLSVAMRLSLDAPIVRRGMGFWIMNTRLLQRSCARSGRFGGSREGSTSIGPCDGEATQKQIRLFCIQEGSERRRDFVKTDNFL